MKDRIVTSSMCGYFMRCPKAYYWAYARGFRSIKLPGQMIVGISFHEQVAAILEGKEPLVIHGGLDPYEYDSYRIGEFLANRYKIFWQEWLETTKVIAVEKVFEAPFEDMTIAGKVDAIVEVGGKPWVLEHKTTSSKLDMDYLEKVSLDGQISAYIWLCKQNGIPVEGVIYDVICTPRIYRRVGEDVETYLDRVEPDYIAAGQSLFGHQNAMRSDESIIEAARVMKHCAVEMDRMELSGYYPQNVWAGQCWARGRTCAYVPLCVMGERPNILGQYEVVNPLRELEDKEEPAQEISF